MAAPSRCTPTTLPADTLTESQTQTTPTDPPPRIPALPHEILDMIFKYALQNILPRLVKIQHTIALDEQGRSIPRTLDCFSGLTCKFTSPWTIPPLLHACARSRYVASKRWPLVFADQGRGRKKIAERPKIFFDYGRDTLYLGGGSKVEVLREWITQFGTRAERAKVQFVAIELKHEGLGMGLDDCEGASLCRIIHDEFPGAREIMFGVENYHQVEGEVRNTADWPEGCYRSDTRVYKAFVKARYMLRWEHVLLHTVPQIRLDLGDWYFENGEFALPPGSLGQA